MAITEALAWRRPVVITRACHFPEVSRARCGIEVGLDAHEMATALLQVLGDSEEAEAMGHRGHDLVMARYTWPRIAEETIDLYRTIIEAKGAST